MDFPPPQSLVIEVIPHTRSDVKLVKVIGPLTVHNFTELQDVTRQQPLPRLLLLDLSEVPYLDSSALGTLVGLHVACEGSERKYGIIGPNERLKSLFALSNVAAFLSTFETLSEAEAALI